MKTNHEWTRIDTNRHADRRAYFNDKRHPNVSAISCPWCDGLMGRWLPGSAGVPPAQSLAQPRLSPPLGSTGNGAMALLRPGRCSSRRQGGCLKHRTEAQWRSKGQDAGGTPALPGDAAPEVRWGVSGRRLLRKPTGTLWETPVCPRAGPPPWRAEARLNMYRARARGFESSREAAAALSRGRKPMERDATKPRAA